MRIGIVHEKSQNLYTVKDFDREIGSYRGIQNFTGVDVNVGDTVIIGFNQGNINDAFIIGVK